MKKMIILLLFLVFSNSVFASSAQTGSVSISDNQSLQNQINSLKKENQDLWFEISALKNEIKRMKKESKSSGNTQFTPVPVIITR